MLASAIIGLCSFALINGAQQQQQEQQEEPLSTKIGPYTFPIVCSDWGKCLQAIADYARGEFKEGSRELVTIDGYEEIAGKMKKADNVTLDHQIVQMVNEENGTKMDAVLVREIVRHVGFPYIFSRLDDKHPQGALKLLGLMSGRPELTYGVSVPCTSLLKKAPVDYFLFTMASVCEDIVAMHVASNTEGFKLTDFWGLVEAAYEKMQNVTELEFQKLFDSEDNSVLAVIGKLLSEQQIFELASIIATEAQPRIEASNSKKLAEKYSTDLWIEKPAEVQKEDEPGDSDLIQKLKSFYEANKLPVIAGMIAVTVLIVIAIVFISVKCC